MIYRRAHETVQEALRRQAAVTLIGPRQVGKTTLAQDIAEQADALYLDLEARADRDKLADPALFLTAYEDRLVILDEVHRVPELFQELRGLIDQGRRKGKRAGRFLILGSASIDLLRQSGESLAGRIEYVPLNPLDVLEAAPDADAMRRLWVRGGFPDSFLAASDADSFTFRQNFIRTYLERDVPQFGRRIPAETLERLWTMLAHSQGTLLNASQLASSLSITAPTVTSYIDLLVDLLLVRRLTPYHANVKKRLVKPPRSMCATADSSMPCLGWRTTTSLPAIRWLARAGKALLSRTSSPWRHRTPRRASIAHRPAPRSTCCLNCPASAVSGLSRSSAVSRPPPAGAFTMRARI